MSTINVIRAMAVAAIGFASNVFAFPSSLTISSVQLLAGGAALGVTVTATCNDPSDPAQIFSGSSFFRFNASQRQGSTVVAGQNAVGNLIDIFLLCDGQPHQISLPGMTGTTSKNNKYSAKPWKKGEVAVDVSMDGTVCYLDPSGNFVRCDGNYQAFSNGSFNVQ